MSTRELPAHPDVRQYRKQAKELLKGARTGDPEARRRMQAHQRPAAGLTLSESQLVIAREHGFESWPKFVKHIEGLLGDRVPDALWRRAEQAVVSGDVSTLERLLLDHEDVLRKQRPRSSWLGGLSPDYDAGDARAIIVRTHHFANWHQFTAHAEAVMDKNSSVARFERAVDAIVSGDLDSLERLLRREPGLVRARSDRTHHSMLLHYVGANGIEGFRQRTPKNAVAVAEALLRAGAEVDAVADMYGGATTLGLLATSIHPKVAGLQQGLIDVLLAHGARLDHPGAAGNAHSVVNGCLANGRPEAAEYLVNRGAPVDLEGAAGVGRLDLVKSFFDGEGRLIPPATPEQMNRGFARACAYGRTSVVEFLLDHGVDVATRRDDGVWKETTGLHFAAFGGHVDTVTALLKRGAPVDAKDATYGTTPLRWALYSWGYEPGSTPSAQHVHVVALLVAAGSKVEPQWMDEEPIRADPKMRAALTGDTMHSV
jgi:ankyrin repeat protein